MARNGFPAFSPLMLALVAAPVALVAQSNTTSALTGLVRDPAGAPVAGATLRIRSASLIGGERRMVTASNGSYRFSALPPGRYTVVVESAGHPTLTGAVLLELGQTATSNWKVAAAAGAVVEVSAQGASMDAAPVGVTANYSTADLATLPADRTLSGIMNLTPGVNANHAWGGDSRENAYLMDGINISDPQSNSRWIEPNPEWFSEIQVGGMGAPAEFGSYTGGYVNGVLKRGGNEFSGSLNGYFGSSHWESRSTNDHPGFTAEERVLAPAKDWEASFCLGGPILKDKLWFFTSFERKAHENTPIGAPVATRRNELLGLTKLSWQALPTATLEGVLEYDYTTHDRRGITSYIAPDATNREIAPNRSYGLTWTQSIGSDKVLTLKAFGYSGRYDEPGYHGEEYGLDTTDTFNDVEYYHNAMPVNYNYRGRASLSATFDLFRTGVVTSGDSHAFRVGLEKEWITDEEVQRNPGGIGLVGQVVTEDDDGNEIPAKVMTDYFYTGGGYDIKEHASRLSFFIQDTWTVNDRLTVRPGLRFEQQKANAYGSPSLWNTTTVAPRLGFTVALTADQRNVLKAHWGRFYAAFSASYIDRNYQSMMPPEVHYAWGTAASGYNPVVIDPSNPATWPKPVLGDPANPASETISSYAPTDPNARQPYMDETMLSLEHKFQGPWSASATYVYRVNKDNLLRKDMAKDDGAWENQTFTDYLHDPSGDTEINVPVWVTTVASDKHQWLVATAPEAKRAFWSASLVLSRQFQDGWSFNASYTRARRYGNTYKSNGYDTLLENPNNYRDANGLLPGFDDNEVKLHGSYELPWKMRVSGVFTYLSGNHFTPYVRTSRMDGVRYYPYLTSRGAEKYPSEHLLDLRVTQLFSLASKAGAEVFAEVFNVLNTGTALAWNERANSEDYRLPSTVERGRRLQVGFRLTF